VPRTAKVALRIRRDQQVLARPADAAQRRFDIGIGDPGNLVIAVADKDLIGTAGSADCDEQADCRRQINANPISSYKINVYDTRLTTNGGGLWLRAERVCGSQ
jgi:hypothetical protein